MLRFVRLPAIVCLVMAAPASMQAQVDHRPTLVIATGADADLPIPTLNVEGTNRDVADLLFLRLAELGPTLNTVGDRGFRPVLARSWTRRDSVTVAFDLDPRARWHDGTPVTSNDVVFTFERARKVEGRLATALHRVSAVTAEGPGRVVFHFTEPYGEQVYDATWHLLVLPAHLLQGIDPDSVASSPFARAPIGSGPFRWVRRISGQSIELASFDRFFLGRPGLRRIVFRVATEAEARLNLLLSGEADLIQTVSLPAAERIRQRPDLAVVPILGPAIVYALFNEKANGDHDRPHPILGDVRVRRALILALDRPTMARAVYGDYATVPDGPVPPIFAWLADPARSATPADTAQARRLLAEAGWVDHDGDGVLDRNGQPLVLSINVPEPDAAAAALRPADAGTLPRARHPPQRRGGGMGGLPRPAQHRALRPRFRHGPDGPDTLGAPEQLDLRHRRPGQPERRQLLRPGGGLADRPGRPEHRRRGRAVPRGDRPHRGRCARHICRRARAPRRSARPLGHPAVAGGRSLPFPAGVVRQAGAGPAPRPYRRSVTRWLLRRSAQAVATLAAVTVILFFLMRAVPGDPAMVLAGERPQSREQIEHLRRQYCLDCPLPLQFASFVRRAVRGDLGTSIRYQGRAVTSLIAERLPASLLLGGVVLVLNFTLGIALGAWQALRHGRLADRVLTVTSLTGYAMPSFWLGLVLAWLFATEWRILPAGGITDVLLSPDAPLLTRALDLGRHLILPALTLTVVSIGATMRYQRGAMLEVLGLDFIRTARAKGLPEGAITRRHAWRNAVFPVLTLFGLWLPILVTGSVFVESVFSWNGLGLLATEAIAYRDYPLLQGTTMLVAGLVILGGLVTDLGYVLLDPRVRDTWQRS